MDGWLIAPVERDDRDEFGPGAWLERRRLPAELRGRAALEALWAVRPDRPGRVRMRGRELDTPRLLQAYGRAYRFSGTDHAALEVPPVLQPYLDWAGDALGVEFNGLLVNWYRDGHDYIGAHADDTRELADGAPIVTVALGQTRRFRVRSAGGAVVRDVDMRDGDVLVMGGTFQQRLKHEVVKVAGQKGRALGPRVSVTLRRFNE